MEVSGKKNRIRVLIERGTDGSYGAYMPEDNGLPFGAIGEGSTAEDAKIDFMNVVNSYREDFDNVPTDECFEFSFDTASFLAYYKDKLSLAGLEHITGVARGQLSHYVTGRRNPSKKTVEKIEKALRSFGEELKSVHLV